MNKIYRKIMSIGIIVAILIPQIVVIAQEDLNNLTKEEIDEIIRQQEEIEKSPQVETPRLSETPPTAEEIEKLIQEQKDKPAETIEYTSNLKQEGLNNATLGNCFDVHKFGNINLSISLDSQEYESGDAIRFTGSIENKNIYPMPDLKIEGKIVKITEEGTRRIVKTVEEIVIKDNINLAAKGSQEIDELYNLPIKAAKGDYEILLSVVQSDQISIAGLSFTDDVYAFNPRFKIGGNNIEEIAINQKGITINDEEYNNLSFNPKYRNNTPVSIKVPIQNNSDTDKEVEITYRVYSWGDDKGEIKEERIEQRQIARQGSSIASYTITEQKEAVYYVKVEVKAVNTRENISWGNIANIRFTNEDISEPRIAAVTVNTSPYNPEQDIQVVSCIHNTNEKEVDTILENTIKDEKGKVIVSSEYKGTVTGQVDGIYTSLPKGARYNQIIVTSAIKDKEGNVLNTVELKYNCQELDPSQCREESNTIENILTIVGSIIGVIIVSGIVILGYRRYRAKKITQ